MVDELTIRRFIKAMEDYLPDLAKDEKRLPRLEFNDGQQYTIRTREALAYALALRLDVPIRQIPDCWAAWLALQGAR